MVIEAANFDAAAKRVVSTEEMGRSGSDGSCPDRAAMCFSSSYTVNCAAPCVVCCTKTEEGCTEEVACAVVFSCEP